MLWPLGRKTREVFFPDALAQIVIHDFIVEISSEKHLNTLGNFVNLLENKLHALAACRNSGMVKMAVEVAEFFAGLLVAQSHPCANAGKGAVPRLGSCNLRRLGKPELTGRNFAESRFFPKDRRSLVAAILEAPRTIKIPSIERCLQICDLPREDLLKSDQLKPALLDDILDFRKTHLPVAIADIWLAGAADVIGGNIDRLLRLNAARHGIAPFACKNLDTLSRKLHPDFRLVIFSFAANLIELDDKVLIVFLRHPIQKYGRHSISGIIRTLTQCIALYPLAPFFALVVKPAHPIGEPLDNPAGNAAVGVRASRARTKVLNRMRKLMDAGTLGLMRIIANELHAQAYLAACAIRRDIELGLENHRVIDIRDSSTLSVKKLDDLGEISLQFGLKLFLCPLGMFRHL